MPKTNWRKLRIRCGQVNKAKFTATFADRLLNIRHLSYDVIPPNAGFYLHAHSVYELIVILDGKARYYTDPEDKSFGRGLIFLFGPHVRHAWRAIEVPCTKFLIYFDLDPAIDIPELESWPVCPELVDEVEELGHVLLGDKPYEHFSVPAHLISIISRALSLTCPAQHLLTHVDTHFDLLDEVEQLLFRNLAHPLTLEEIAIHVDLSVRQLQRSFHKVSGETITSHIMRLRLDRARDLLRETDKKISCICAQVGIPNPSYFFRSFRRYFGITPEEYRQIASKNKEVGMLLPMGGKVLQ